MGLPNWLNYKTVLFLLLGNLTFSQQWESLGGGANDQVRDIWIDTITNELYASGNFTQIGGIQSNGLAKWDGTSWTNLFPHQGFQQIYRIAKVDGVLYISGLFYMDGQQTFLAKNDGSGWIRDDRLSAFCLINPFEDTLYLRYGQYTEIDGISQSVLSKLVDGEWQPAIENYDLFGGYEDFRVNELVRYQGKFILGGQFKTSDYSIVNIASYIDGNYFPVGEVFSGGDVEELIEFKSILYVGTNSLSSFNFPYDFLFAWNGQEYFNPFPDVEFRFSVRDLEVINGELYISSVFNFKNDTTIYYLAKYDGESFCAFGGGYPNQSSITSSPPLKVAGIENEIYVIGGDDLLHDTINFIGKWIGTEMDTCIFSPITVSLPEKSIKSTLKLYPNPSHEQIKLNFENSGIENEEVIILDQVGKEVLRQTISPKIGLNEVSIDVRDLKSGVYFVSLKNSGKYATTKLVKL